MILQVHSPSIPEIIQGYSSSIQFPFLSQISYIIENPPQSHIYRAKIQRTIEIYLKNKHYSILNSVQKGLPVGVDLDGSV